MNLIEHAVKRPTAVAMAGLVVLFTGIFSASRLPLALTPDVDFPKLTITTSWYDTSPETVEAFVTSPIEAVANTVTNVHKVSSVSEEGLSKVTVEFTRGTNMNFAAMELNEKLSAIREQLPYGTSPPQIVKYIPEKFQTDEFLTIHLTGTYSLQELRRIALEKIKPTLMGLKGIADVQVIGGQDRELEILVNKRKLNAYNISLGEVEQTLLDLGHSQSIGTFRTEKERITLFVDTPLKESSEIEDAILLSKNGSVVHIKDIAEVHDSYGKPRSLSRIDGHPAVVLHISREVGSNTIKTADRVFKKLKELQKKLPSGLDLIIEQDQSREIRRSLSDLSERSLFSILVIFLVLLAFLRTFRAPLIILSTIFFSTLFTLNLFVIFKIGLNLLTLAGLALGFGMLVDNAIVVVENISHHHQTGKPLTKAAVSGTSEVVLAVVASTLTTVVAFIPFLYLTGELRIYYLPFTLAVGFSLLSSLIIAFTLTPSITVKLFSKNRWEEEVDRAFKPIHWYQNFLKWIINHRGITTFLAFLILGASTYLFQKYVTKGRIFYWHGDTYISVNIEMPKGAEIKRTDQIARHFEKIALEEKKGQRVGTFVYPEFAYVRILFPRALRKTAYPLILKEKLINAASQIAGASVGVFGFGEGFFTGGGSGGSMYRIKVLGYNYNKVKEIAEALAKRLKRYNRVKDINTNASVWWNREDVHEIVLRIDREKLARFHMTPVNLLSIVQANLRENLAWQRIKLGGRELEYRIKFQEYKNFSMDDLKNLLIKTPSDETLRLREVARVERRKTMGQIIRENQQYQRIVSFEYRGPYKLGDRLVDTIVKTTHLPPGYSVERATYFFLKEEEKHQIYLVLGISLVLVFLVTAGLFESLLHPFLILFTVPLSLSGVFLIFYLTGSSFDRSAYIGVILLGGIVVNDSILLVDHINNLRRKGVKIIEAVISGTSDRLRPILMTTFTTIGGLLPLVFLSSGGSEDIWYSLSLATIGGLLASTTMVLTVIPALYVSFERLKIKTRGILRNNSQD